MFPSLSSLPPPSHQKKLWNTNNKSVTTLLLFPHATPRSLYLGLGTKTQTLWLFIDSSHLHSVLTELLSGIGWAIPLGRQLSTQNWPLISRLSWFFQACSCLESLAGKLTPSPSIIIIVRGQFGHRCGALVQCALFGLFGLLALFHPTSFSPVVKPKEIDEIIWQSWAEKETFPRSWPSEGSPAVYTLHYVQQFKIYF